MLRLTLPTALCFLASCASTRTSDLILGDALAAPASAPAADVPAAQPAVELGHESPGTGSGAAALPALSMPIAAAQEESLHGSRFTIKAGYYGADEDAIDDGYIIGVSWMRFFSKIFAVELETGYLDADGSDGPIDGEIWAIPLFVNGRFNLPVWVLDLYAGAGVGGFYYDAEADDGVTSVSDDGFLLAGDAFVGGTINVADAIALGLEAKYLVSEESDDLDASLDAFALMLTLGWSR